MLPHLRGKEQYYWFTHLPNHETVYFRYHRCGEHPAYPMAAFQISCFNQFENGTRETGCRPPAEPGWSSRCLLRLSPDSPPWTESTSKETVRTGGTGDLFFGPRTPCNFGSTPKPSLWRAHRWKA